MSIKALALDLYRAQQEVDQLEKALEESLPTDQEEAQREKKEKLRIARAEYRMIRKMLDGEKEIGASRMKNSSLKYGKFKI